jgi:predicted PurR-regulated permease PerM
MTILEPLVALLTKIKIPRVVAVLITYVLIIGGLGGVIALIVPALIDQTTSFVNSLPGYLSNIGVDQSTSSQFVKELLTRLGNVPGEVLKFTFSVFANLISVITVLVFAFYMLLTRNKLDDQLSFFFGEERKKGFTNLIDTIEERLGGWARGELTLMLIVGVAIYIGLTLIGIPFALPLSILAGVLEIIPYLGPILSATPGVLIGFGISPVTGFIVAGLFFVVQQLENYLLVPKIMSKSVGVSPIIILVALAIGARLAGVVGMIISVPSVITLQILMKQYFLKE